MAHPPHPTSEMKESADHHPKKLQIEAEDHNTHLSSNPSQGDFLSKPLKAELDPEFLDDFHDLEDKVDRHETQIKVLQLMVKDFMPTRKDLS